MNDCLERRHPDLFTAEEALIYLHQARENRATLDTLREKGLLRGKKIGPELVYHRAELDRCVSVLFADVIELPAPCTTKKRETGPRLRIANGK